MLVAKVSTPVIYMIWPPDVPHWEALVEEDGSGVKRPRRGEAGIGDAGWTGIWWLFVLGLELAVLWGIRV